MGLGNIMNESKLALSGLPSCLPHTPPPPGLLAGLGLLLAEHVCGDDTRQTGLLLLCPPASAWQRLWPPGC